MVSTSAADLGGAISVDRPTLSIPGRIDLNTVNIDRNNVGDVLKQVTAGMDGKLRTTTEQDGVKVTQEAQKPPTSTELGSAVKVNFDPQTEVKFDNGSDKSLQMTRTEGPLKVTASVNESGNPTLTPEVGNDTLRSGVQLSPSGADEVYGKVKQGPVEIVGKFKPETSEVTGSVTLEKSVEIAKDAELGGRVKTTFEPSSPPDFAVSVFANVRF